MVDGDGRVLGKVVSEGGGGDGGAKTSRCLMQPQILMEGPEKAVENGKKCEEVGEDREIGLDGENAAGKTTDEEVVLEVGDHGNGTEDEGYERVNAVAVGGGEVEFGQEVEVEDGEEDGVGVVSWGARENGKDLCAEVVVVVVDVDGAERMRRGDGG